MNLVVVQETVTKLPEGIHDEFGFCHISFRNSGVRIEICPDKIDERLGSLFQIIGIAAFLSDEFGKTLTGPHTQVALDVLDLVCGFGVALFVEMSQEYKHVKAKKIAKRSSCVIREDSSVFVYFIRISNTLGNGGIISYFRPAVTDDFTFFEKRGESRKKNKIQFPGRMIYAGQGTADSFL